MVTRQRCESMTVAALIRRLAETEDALRTCPRCGADGRPDPRRRRLLREQDVICAGLRQRRHEMATRPLLG